MSVWWVRKKARVRGGEGEEREEERTNLGGYLFLARCDGSKDCKCGGRVIDFFSINTDISDGETRNGTVIVLMGGMSLPSSLLW